MMQEADEFCAENEPTGQEWSQNGLRAPEDKLEVATEKIEVAIQSATIMSPGGTPPPAICWGIGLSGPSALRMLYQCFHGLMALSANKGIEQKNMHD